MPIYKMRCPVCGGVEDNVFLRRWDEQYRCKNCKCVMSKIPSLLVPHVFPAEGIFLEHVSPEGKRFFSKQEMKDYAKKHDLEIGYLE